MVLIITSHFLIMAAVHRLRALHRHFYKFDINFLYKAFRGGGISLGGWLISTDRILEFFH